MRFSNCGLCLAVVCVLLFQRHCVDGIRRYHSVCAPDAIQDMRFICQDDTFIFPFRLPKRALIMRYHAPSERFFPFQHRFHTCCKRGCQAIGLRKMCLFHVFHKICVKLRGSTVLSHLKYARCLVGKTEAKLAHDGYPTRKYRSKRSVDNTHRRKLIVV